MPAFGIPLQTSRSIALAALVLVGGATACEATLPQANAADAARVAARFGNPSLSELQQGRSLYLARCGTCHALRDPRSESAEAWSAQVRDMRTNKGVLLSPDEERRITAYLVSISAR